MSGFDDIDSDIAAAIESTSAPASAPATPPSKADAAPTPSVEPAPAEKAPEGARARDESGRFVAKTDDKPAATEKKNEAPVETAGGQPQAPKATQDAPISAPVHWKGAGKVDWNSLPRHVQAALNEDYARIAKADSELQNWSQVISPERAQAFAAQYGSTHEAVRRLLALSDFATKQPAEFLRQFAQSNRIDLSQLVQGAVSQNGQQPVATAEPHPLEREVVQLRNQWQQYQQQQRQQAEAAIMVEVNRFKADPAHPYYNDVENEILAMLPSIQGSSPSERLKQAYDRAVWANPTTREYLIKDQRERLAREEAQRVAQARSAAGSVSGSPKGAVVASDEPDTDLESFVRKQVNALA